MLVCGSALFLLTFWLSFLWARARRFFLLHILDPMRIIWELDPTQSWEIPHSSKLQCVFGKSLRWAPKGGGLPPRRSKWAPWWAQGGIAAHWWPQGAERWAKWVPSNWHLLVSAMHGSLAMQRQRRNSDLKNCCAELLCKQRKHTLTNTKGPVIICHTHHNRNWFVSKKWKAIFNLV